MKAYSKYWGEDILTLSAKPRGRKGHRIISKKNYNNLQEISKKREEALLRINEYYDTVINLFREGKDVYVYQYQQFDPRGYLNPLKMEVFDWDNMNFAIQEMRASLERRQKENNWVKTMLIPISLIAASAMISLIMMKFSLDYSQGLRAAAQANPQPQQDPTPSIPIIGDVFNPAE